jgi:glycosyltransferase involved in cell wall biosynthesis
VAERIHRYYGRTAEVVHPPVDTERFTPGGERGEDFLYVGRLVGYKRADLAVEAFAGLPHRLIVVGDGHMGPELRARATPNVTFLGKVDDATLLQLYRQCRAMVFPADEDFGISMAEAQACGAPVISVDRGGALDIVEPGVTGWLVPSDDVTALRAAVRRAAVVPLDQAAVRTRAESFSVKTFRRRIRAAVDDVMQDPRPR